MTRFRCVLMGEESLAIQCGEILVRDGHGIVAVVSENPSIERWARDRGIEVVSPHCELHAALGGLGFEYLFSITNLRIVPGDVLSLPSRRAINFHDGPLPRYAGLYAPAWALIQRETRYGVSFHEMSRAVDAGAMLEQVSFDIDADETSLSLNAKCYEAGIQAFERLVARLAEGSEVPVAQDLDQRSQFGRFDRPAAAGGLDFRRSADEISALVRALDFGRYPNPLAAAKLHHRGSGAIVKRATAVDAPAGAEPGTLLALDATRLTVATSSGGIELSAFADTFGRELSCAQVAQQLGLRVGQPIDGIRGELADHIDAIQSRLCRSEAFWIDRLRDLTPIAVPLARRDAAGAPRFERIPLAIPRRFACVPDADPTPAVLVAAATAYLARIADQSRFDLTFRSPSLDRLQREGRPWVAGWVPLRFEIPAATTLAAHCANALAELARVERHGGWFEDAIGRTPALARDPLLAAGRALPVAIEWVASDVGTAAAPRFVEPAGVELCFRIGEAGRSAELGFDPQAIEPEAAATLARRLERFLRQFADASPDTGLGELSLLEPAERQRLLVEWNRTETPVPKERCVHELFEQQVSRTPDAIAVVFDDRSLTYRQLDRCANRLAHRLRERGIGPERLVGIHIGRSLEMVVATLAIHKAGGGYVPLDPGFPAQRIEHMIRDSRLSLVLTQSHAEPACDPVEALRVDAVADAKGFEPRDDAPPATGVGAANVAYVIYTSGSTGTPKGVAVEHRNVVNFFAGMDQHIDADAGGVWLAVTSLSFDISVLELAWTLARGFTVVIQPDRGHGLAVPRARPIDFGLFMWGSDSAQGDDKYRLMLESARFGDRNGFAAFWTPERHFHAFGGPYPNPALTGAAIAATTERIAIRGGSCVLPLHHPIRVAEEWAVVDNLSGGRVGIAFASGWQPNDFVIRPESYKHARTDLYRDIDLVQRLWRGEPVEFGNPLGEAVPTRSLPRPLQPELPTWVTTAGNPDTFRRAGAIGANLLTHLLGQSLDEVAEKIRVYRSARREAGFDPDAGIVTLMLHTLVGPSDAEVREIAREPMKNYLRSSVSLVKDHAWAFPAFRRPGGPDAVPDDVDLDALEPDEFDSILEFAFERYFETSGLFGSIETCLETVERVRAIGVDEIACLIDYGVDTERTLEGLEYLDEVRRRSNEPRSERGAAPDATDTLAAVAARHAVTHLQCTPTLARMLLADAESKPALAQLEHLLVGGEALPQALAAELSELVPGRLSNMYGPTETTIWSAVAEITRAPGSAVPIGRPIANTRMYIVDSESEPVPIGVAGELWIGGDGVSRGYLGRDELTSQRFVPDPFSSAPGRLYRTGDLARYRPDGQIEFLGRIDQQVKIRGYRVELGEIEACLAQHPRVRGCAAIVREDEPGDQRLVAYLICDAEPPTAAELRGALEARLPDYMVPSAFVVLDAFPLTPNRKIDRNALPAPARSATTVDHQPPSEGIERTIADAWQSVLRIESVGTHDNFFDLGGHSLLVVAVHRLLRERIGRPVALTDLYRFPTIASLAAHLEGSGTGGRAAAEAHDRAEKRRALSNRRRRRSGK